MAQYVWQCPYCTDSVRGSGKGLVFQFAEKHLNTRHGVNLEVDFDSIKKEN